MPEYFPRDGMMLYASFTEGYKSGFIADQIVPSPAAPNGGVIPFNHENVETFELGLQLAATENLRFDASVGKLNHEIVRLDVSGAPTPPGFQREIGVKAQGSSRSMSEAGWPAAMASSVALR